MMGLLEESLDPFDLPDRSALVYSFSPRIGPVAKSVGFGLPVTRLSPYLRPWGSYRIKRLVGTPSFVLSTVTGLIKEHREEGMPAIAMVAADNLRHPWVSYEEHLAYEELSIANEQELTQAQQRYEDSHRKQAALREGLEAQEKKLRGLRDMVDRKGQTVGQLKIEKAETREKLQSHEQKLATLAGDVKTLNEEIEQKIQKETETVDRLDKITEEISRLEQRLREEETSLSALKETIETAELSQRRERERLRSIEEEKTKAFRELQALKERIAEKRLELTQQDMTIEGLVKETLNRFQIDPRQPLPRDEDQETAPPSEEEIEKLEKKLAGIGEINFVAVKEFDELQERLVFLERQKADLLEAIQTLTETIQRINRVTSSRFKETYDKVQAYFSELFQKLFGGGKGELRLTDPTNYRETGIEIFAQPPGKRLQVIRLLSGGEKALVAIAFLFAMFLTRPSPFCVLDEVDAPLDEGNIDRFNQLITELSSLSQFILITHNKRTMASADTLLGVTMEQPGVSKIVSVSLGEFENEAA
jgi:chromosome segregation protein